MLFIDPVRRLIKKIVREGTFCRPSSSLPASSCSSNWKGKVVERFADHLWLADDVVLMEWVDSYVYLGSKVNMCQHFQLKIACRRQSGGANSIASTMPLYRQAQNTVLSSSIPSYWERWHVEERRGHWRQRKTYWVRRSKRRSGGCLECIFETNLTIRLSETIGAKDITVATAEKEKSERCLPSRQPMDVTQHRVVSA